MNHGIILHEEYRERMKKFSPERLGLLIQNLFKVDDGEEPLSFPDDEALDVLSEVLISRYRRDVAMLEKQRANGMKGGAPVGNQNAKKTTQKQPKNNPKTTQKQPKTNPYTYTYTYTNTYTNKDKKTYGVLNNVLLSDEEYNKIVDAGLSGLIDELSTYIDSKGAKYKSHYATILSWGRRREKEKPRGESKAFKGEMSTRDYNFDELEKRLIKN